MSSQTDESLQTTDFENVISTLWAVYEICQQKKQICEKISLDCRKVIKPWPKKKVDSGKSITLNAKPASENKNDSTVKEDPSVTLVDKALAKAERTWNKFQAKDNDQKDLKPAEPVIDQRTLSVRAESHSTKSKPPSAKRQNPPNGRGKITENTISQSRLNKILDETKQKSVVSQRSTSKSKYVPVSTRAPFKTEPERRLHGSIIRVKSADRSKPNSANVSRTKPGVLKSNTHIATTETNQTMLKPEPVVNKAQDTERISEALPKLEQLSLTETSNIEQDDKKETRDEKFDFLKDGKNLTMPGKFNKLMSHNRRLREKGNAEVTRQKVPASNCAQVFMEQLHTSMHADRSKEAVDTRRMLSLSSLYHALHKLLLNVQQKVSGPGDLRWQEILRCKQHLDLVFGTFSYLEAHYQKLISGAPNVENLECPVDLTPKPAMSSLCWLPEFISTVPQCSKLRYSNRRQLVTYTSQLYNLQVLLLEKHLLQEMQQLISSLRHATGRETWFVPVYRGLYSMVCSMGCVFPTIVTDSIDTPDDDNQSWENDF